jgi:hypothetical protein
MRIQWLVVLASAIILCACESKQPTRRASPTQKPSSIHTDFLDDIIPLANGAAYAVGMDGIWYLLGSTAVRVRALGDSSSRAEFVTAVSMDVQPTVDGGAYAYSFTGVWRLEADSAVRVVEADSLIMDTTTTRRSPDSLGWLLYTKERRERALTREEAEAEMEPPNDAAEEFP